MRSYIRNLRSCEMKTFTHSFIHLHGPFPSSFGPHYENETNCKVLIMKMSSHSYANKTNFLMKTCALNLARKWPIGMLMVGWGKNINLPPP